MDIPYLNYTDSLLGLSASLLAHYGAQPSHTTMAYLDPILAAAPRNIVVLLLDGLGLSTLEAHLPADTFLRQHMRRAISSTVPPTTTAATVTMVSGLSPAEHGWLGWTLYFDEINANIDIFRNTLHRSAVPSPDPSLVGRTLHYTPLTEQIERATQGRISGHIVSAFSQYRANDLEAVCTILEDICAKPGEHYCYAYWNEPDSDMHEQGVHAPSVGELVRYIDRRVEALAKALPDTMLIVVADHGLIDVSYCNLARERALMDCLRRPPTMESRCVSLACKPGRESAFESLFHARFGDAFALIPAAEALSGGLFGPGAPHPRTLGFLGDFIACARTPLSLDYDTAQMEGEYTPPFKAAHAGLTADELRIPLILL